MVSVLFSRSWKQQRIVRKQHQQYAELKQEKKNNFSALNVIIWAHIEKDKSCHAEEWRIN